MGAAALAHPGDQTLQSYGLGKLDESSAELVNEHLSGCPQCQRRVAELSSDSFLGRLRNAQGLPVMSATDKLQRVGTDIDQELAAAWSPPPADTLPPGLAGHRDYEVVRELGRGGMGVVYLARNKLMGRLEVLKVIGGHLIERPGARERFMREVRSAAKLQHKNIVTAYSAMRLDESMALAMEYVDGDDLAKVVKSGGPMVVINACYVVYQAAQGLQHAHERGMVHRDIKPANLILSRDGKKVVKVLDFGLAKVTSETHADTGLTREGQMLGTPDYIAPEQIRNALAADVRADIYSLGCTFYYLLAGAPPFRGDNLWDLYQAHFSMDAGPLNLVRPDVPVELAALVAKMMAKEPHRRFQTPGEVARALIPFLKKGREREGEPSAGESQGTPRAATPNSSEVVCLSTNPARSRTPARPAQPDQPEVAAPQPKSNWGSLIEIDETGSLMDAATASADDMRRSRWLWPSAAGAVIVFAFIAAWANRQNMFKGNETLPADRSIPSARVDVQDRTAPGVSPPGDATKTTESRGPGPSSTQNAASESVEGPKPGLPAKKHVQKRVLPLDRDQPPPVPVRPSEVITAGDVGKKGAVDIRRVISQPDIKQLHKRNSILPIGGFWPSLSPESLENWQIADPDHITMKEEGVYLEAGTNGNLLLTRNTNHRKCTLKLTLSMTKGTEAFVALRAHRGADGWEGVTAHLVELGGKIHTGRQTTDFQTQEADSERTDIELGKPFVMTFQIDEKNAASVSVKGHKTSSAVLERAADNANEGAVGVFVASGTLIVRRMLVEDH
jgi:serine/threonine protein kinase